MFFRITDEELIEAYRRAGFPPRVDAPSIESLLHVRRELRLVDPEMLCLHYIRNRLVKIRKAGKLPKRGGGL